MRNEENGREKAQKTQDKNSLFAIFVPFRGHSVGPNGRDLQSDIMTLKWFLFWPHKQGQKGAVMAKPGQSQSK
jgi:hypothetical protein